ncbi:uncharacterized protein Z518_08518 [Rhinocladiella mackenziei CBS 650.93]|uniref:Zn(2)-C6 fungal-type domain-containing protein n=1 Tax=Rhinocladiella mackenziei CBS 650.93 TaxID=1442369 RepID=A0A0D2FKW8_9EURO|nr:uncharacterized protein Z518_08518 [Rhinocladiella mackenziei CBS 650.93]KIX02577.1 hypothetical protein Z518_08518 [Rhinocladiella mackenziei CBS 650.93]
MLASRKKLACRICTRRKVKCDKQIPCNNCSKRGAPEECNRDQSVEPSAPNNGITGHNDVDVSSTVSALRIRVAELEAALQQRSAQSGTDLTPVPGNEGRVGPGATRTSSPSHDSEIEDAATVLEFLAWGRMKDPDRTRLSPEVLRATERDERVANSPADNEDDALLDSNQSLLPWVQILLPSRRQVTQLVEYHNECLLWFHGSYFAPSLLKQLASFYHDHRGRLESPGVNLQWVALLFAVMAGTITSAPTYEANKWRFEEKEIRVLSQKWYRVVIALLNAAGYTANHSLYSVQAIATLTSTAHILGHSNSQSVMLASAVRIAQSLGLHRLNEDARGDAIELETGRRVWEQLCTQDWFSTSFSETYTINHLHCTSLPPKNCDDDLVEMPESVPTVTSFCRFLATIASIMPRLQDGMASSNTLYTKHEQVLFYDRKMRSLATEGRPSFLANTPIEESWPCYIPWARRAIAMSSAHKIIMIHRKFLSLSFTNPVFAFTRRTCLAAAKTILREYIAISHDDSSPTLWTHQAFSVAACIIICLDMLHQSSIPVETQSQLVTQTIEILEASGKRSMIASRGVKLLKALQKRIRDASNGQKRSADDVSENGARKRRRTFDVTEFVRAFCNSGDARSPGDVDTVLPNHEAAATGQDRIESENNALPIDSERPLNPTLECNRIWDIPFDESDGSQPFENLMFLANQGVCWYKTGTWMDPGIPD